MTTKTIRTWISYRCRVHKLATERPLKPTEVAQYRGRLAELESLKLFCDLLDSSVLPSSQEWQKAGMPTPRELCEKG